MDRLYGVYRHAVRESRDLEGLGEQVKSDKVGKCRINQLKPVAESNVQVYRRSAPGQLGGEIKYNIENATASNGDR